MGRTVSCFEIFNFDLLDPEILSAERSILRPLKFLHSSAEKLRTYRVVVHMFRNIFFKPLDLEPEIGTSITQKHFLFRAAVS